MGVANISGNILTDSGTNLSSLVSGTGTTNYVSKFTSSSAIGNSSIFDNGTSVGVGTATPFGTFNVVAGTNKSLIIQDSGIADTIEIASYSTSGGTRAIAMNGSVLTFGTGTAGGGSATARLTINATGNIGINTSTPSSFSGYTNLTLKGGSFGSNLDFHNTSNTRIASIVSTSGTDFKLEVLEAIPLIFNVNSTERMRITASGNVQIDNGQLNSPKSLSFQANSNTGGNLGTIDWYNFQWDGAIRAQIKGETDTGLSNGRLVFSTGGGGVTERMRITSSGQVYVGTTSSLSGTLNSTTTSGLYALTLFDGFGNNAMMDIKNSSNVRAGSITISGTTTAYNTSSDYRLKEDFKEINGLEKLSEIKVYNYKWKDNNDRMDGVIAHELAEVLPYAVVGEKDSLNEDGTINPQGVDYSKLVPILVKSIQELQAKIVTLESKIN